MIFPFQEIQSLGSREDTESDSHTTHHVTENDTEKKEEEAEEEKMEEEERGHSRGEDSIATDTSIAMGTSVQPSFWQQVMDPNTNHPYYWNPLTNEVLWSLPEGGVITGGGVGGVGEGEEEEYFDFYKESGSSGDYSKVRSGGGGRGGGERKSEVGKVSSKVNVAVAESAAATGEGKSNIPLRVHSESTSATDPASQPKGTEKMESETEGGGGGGGQKPEQDEEEMDFVGPLLAIGKASVGGGRREEEGDQDRGGERGMPTVSQAPPSWLKRKAEERGDELEQGEEDEVVLSHLEHTFSVQAGCHTDNGSVSPPKKMARSARSLGRALEEKLSRKSYGNCSPCYHV